MIRQMRPLLNEGDYVFCTVNELSIVNIDRIVFHFKEKEGFTIVADKNYADSIGLGYEGIFSWISLDVHSSLNAVGLTATFSNALYEEGIACNVVAAFYHDHIFVGKADAEKAIDTLKKLSVGNIN